MKTKPTEKIFMTTKTLAKVLAIAAVISACGGAKETSTEAKTEVEPPLADQLVMSTLWFQNSEEARQIFEQSYDLAELRLAQNLAALKQGQRPAVILDLDETVLDNSPYEARLIAERENYASESWAEWVREAKADVLPGAADFLQKATDAGVQVFYVSNRRDNLLEPTLQNLEDLDLPNAEADYVLLKSNTSDKTERREEIKETYKVILLIGDQMTDFAEDYQSFSDNSALQDSLDRHFVLLPNPMYGGFEAEAYDGNWELTDRQKSEKRKQALEQKK